MSITPTKLHRPTYCFTEKDITEANANWGCNCGPAALAAILAVNLDVVRKAIPGFEGKGYTNPTMMKAALERLGVKWRDRRSDDAENNYSHEMADVSKMTESPLSFKPTDYRWFKPHTMVRYGLVRIQFEPWYGRLAYHFTHWVAAIMVATKPAGVTVLIPQLESGRVHVPEEFQEFAGLWVFDVNYGWRKFDDWASKMPELAKCGSPKSDGNWHATHRWEIEL